MKFVLRDKLARANDFLFSLFAIVAAFSTYSCMYAFRKPVTVATFSGISFWEIDYKILLIIAQVIGYTLAKFAGIKFISEMPGRKRAISIMFLLTLSLLALFFFGIVPPPYNIPFLILNGFPLGMVWGLVFSYLEGRRNTEILGAGLSVSFIFSSGFVKTIGKIVMDTWGVTEYWMPFVTGALFILPAAFFIWMLDQLPPPTALDEKLRTKRKPMNKNERAQFIKAFAPGLLFLVILYVLLTAFRDFRDNFSAELWNSLGYGYNQMIFTTTEIPISIGVLIILCLVIFIRSNINALLVLHWIILVGVLTVGISTWAFENGWINPAIWMTVVGFGLFLAYIPFNSVLFDKLIAAFKYVSNAGFLIYVADAFGYLGSTGLLLYKNFGQANLSWLSFFISSCYILALAGAFLSILSIIYFKTKHDQMLELGVVTGKKDMQEAEINLITEKSLMGDLINK